MKKQVIQICKILILLIYKEAFFLFWYLDLNDKLQVKSAAGRDSSLSQGLSKTKASC